VLRHCQREPEFFLLFQSPAGKCEKIGWASLSRGNRMPIILARKGAFFMSKHFRAFLAAILLSTTLSGCGYNSLQGMDEDVKSAWGEVENQYQRRADLIPNLVNVVKGYAKHEEETLTKVMEARAGATKVTLDASKLSNKQALENFEQAQGQLSSALSRLMVVAEKYPDLKANENFKELQSQLEGTENRISIARRRFIESVNEYNKGVRYFPTNLTAKFLLHLEPRETFKATTPGAEKAPEVKF
jgi:LemA protein